jgi:hypothetical protein
MDWRPFDGVYLYNPFGELLPDRPFIDDGGVVRTPERYREQVAATQARLATMRGGARLVTYHGFGGQTPPGWHIVSGTRLDDGALTCWIKTTD